MDEFNKLKIYHMKKLEEAKEKYLADQPIYYILDLINSLDFFFTTSSCAGRIILLKIPKSGKKFEAEFLFKSHYYVNFYYIWNKLLEVYKNYDEKIYFKQEPFILHVSSKNIEKAYELLNIARKSGFKHSGIFLINDKRVMVEIVGNEKIETIVSKNRKLLVSKEYFYNLVKEANEKLKKVRNRIDIFYKNLLSYYITK
jgi:tRNA wybutosine-synthesizing protein 3